MSTELATIDERSVAIERAGELWRGKLSSASEAGKTLILATAIRSLDELITLEMVEAILPLQNTDLGFRTDRDPATTRDAVPYDAAIVRRIWVQAEIMGARMVGNEINIIASRLYPAKNYFLRKVRETPGFSHDDIELGNPQTSGGQCSVAVTIKYKMNGQPQKYTCLVWVRLNNGATIDNIHGKATRKAYAKLLQQLQGGRDESGDDGERIVEVDSRVIDEQENRRLEHEANVAHNSAEGSQEETEEQIRDRFLHQISKASTSFDLAQLDEEIRATTTAGKLRRDNMSAVWAAFRSREKDIKAGKA